MAGVAGDEIPGEQIDFGAAMLTVDRLDPEEVLHWHVRIAVERAVRDVRVSDLDRELVDESVGGVSVRGRVEVLDLFADHPRRHGIDVYAQHVAADPVRFEQRSSSPHEGIRDRTPGEVVGCEEGLGEWAVAEFGERQPAKQGARPAGEPLVNGDDRPVVLLDLFLSAGHRRDERYVEAGFDGHGITAHATSGMNVTSPAAVSPGASTMIPVSVRPASARLKPSMQLVAGSTQKKSCRAGV